MRARIPAHHVYVIVLCVAVAAFLPQGVRSALQAPQLALLWMALIAIANFRTIAALPRVNMTTSVAAPVSVAASVVLPLPLVVLVKLLGQVNEREFRPGTSKWAIAFNRTQAALSAGAAAWAARLIGTGGLPRLMAATAAAGVVYFLVNTAAVAGWSHFRYGVGLAEAMKGALTPFPHFGVDFALIIGLAAPIVVLNERVGPFAVLFFALPLWLGYQALQSARESEDRAEELSVRVRELEMLADLGSDLLAARRRDQVERITEEALSAALKTAPVRVALVGEVPDDLLIAKVPGAAGTAIGVSADTDDRSMDVVEAAAGLLGMALRRLDLEEELGEVERARSNLAGQILEEGTRERSRIAVEIHDEVLPYLAAAEIQADNIRSAISGKDVERANGLAGATRAAVHDGIARLRGVLEALTCQIVVPGGLRQSLEKALARIQLEHGIDSRLHAVDPLPPLPLPVEMLVSEVVRGCLANVVNHAYARSLAVRIEATDGLIAVGICDDGRGFVPGHVPDGHHGLALMRQRVELARGRFTVSSGPYGGTRVEVEVPL